MRLYEIDNDLRELLAHGQEFTEDTPVEVTDNWMANFEELKGDRDKKLESVYFIARELRAEAEAIEIERKRLANRQIKMHKQADRVEKMIESSMINGGENEIKTGLFTAKFKKNPPSFVFNNCSELTDITTKIEEDEIKVKVSKSELAEQKKSIRDRVKAGEEIDGVEMVQKTVLKFS